MFPCFMFHLSDRQMAHDCTVLKQKINDEKELKMRTDDCILDQSPYIVYDIVDSRVTQLTER